MTLVETKNTILSIEEITYALKEGWFLNFNYYPTKEQLAVLWAQACLETGRGKFLRNYNFGNIKRTKDHMYCQYECSEIINGKEYKLDEIKDEDDDKLFCWMRKDSNKYKEIKGLNRSSEEEKRREEYKKKHKDSE